MTQKNIFHRVLQISVCLIVFLSSTYLFYHQATTVDGSYLSDLQIHINAAQPFVGYSLLYWTMGILKVLANGNIIPIIIFEGLLILATGWITYSFMKKLLPNANKSFVFLISFALLFLTSIYLPVYHPSFYKDTHISQPWHNITYTGMRLFGLITMYSFSNIYENYLKGINLKQWCKIAIPLLIATAIKPNFLMSFAFALLAILIIDFFRNFFDKEKFFNMIKMGTTVFPACFMLLAQSIIIYAPTEAGPADSGIILIWGSPLLQNGVVSLIAKMLCGLAFPTLIYICYKKYFSRNVHFAYLMYLVTFIEANMLGETGRTANHGNFGWGLPLSAYVLFMYTISVFIKQQSIKEKNWKTITIGIIGWVLLALHLVCGLYYFYLLLIGAPAWSV